MSFSAIPVRANGQRIQSTWFNTLRTNLLNYFGNDSTPQTQFAGAASQTGTNVTGLVFSSTTTRRAKIEYVIVTATKVESGEFILLWDGTNWTKYDGPVQGVDSLISLAVVAGTGQVTYDSGAETFTLDYKATTFNI